MGVLNIPRLPAGMRLRINRSIAVSQAFKLGKYEPHPTASFRAFLEFFANLLKYRILSVYKPLQVITIVRFQIHVD
jgi:hypothetical protein